MSIALGLYDVFAYTVPGFIYLFVFYQILAKYNLININLYEFVANAEPIIAFVISLAAFLLGHLLDDFAHWFVLRLFRKESWITKSLQLVEKSNGFKKKESFQERDWGILFSIIQQHNPQYFHTLNIFESNSIMLANTSLALFFYSIVQGIYLMQNFSIIELIIFIVVIALMLAARKRSQKFHLWFYIGLFEASLAYGRTAKDVIKYHQGIFSSKK